MADTARFLIRSPLAAAASILQTEPAPFWAALSAQEEKHANMQVSTFTMTLSSINFSLEGETARGKRAKPTPLTVTVPALVNTKTVDRGQVIVFSGSLALAETEETQCEG